MIKTARQLKDLIRNLSKEKSADAQLLMRNYMMERLIFWFIIWKQCWQRNWRQLLEEQQIRV